MTVRRAGDRPRAARTGLAVRVRGLVQGVGFRPAVWRLAHARGIAGEVWNDPSGVMIHAWGERERLSSFVRDLREQAPPLARIDGIEVTPLAGGTPPHPSFRIVQSRGGRAATGVLPDAATCSACLAEIFDPLARRYRYPFTNCTHCGPRLSIVRAIPYDRATTTMAGFAMCPACRAEYEDPADRRFHAQPLACPACGPRAWLERLDGSAEPVPEGDPVARAAALIGAGAIVAIKGIGGFHLACDAADPGAVERLRARKRRDGKPFALMARDVDAIRGYCNVTPAEEALLRSAAAPIVIHDAAGPRRLPEAVAPGQRTLGFMLPYTPLHHLLLADLDRPIVLTSGNVSDEPQCTGNGEARRRLAPVAEWGLLHDRDIACRADDSVVRVTGGEARVLRRARGYAPAPLPLPDGFAGAPAVLALGGELKSTFCVLRDGQGILSQHIGDLADADTWADYRRMLAHHGGLLGHEPAVLAVDPHPEYLSTKLGRERAARDGVPIETVQHHHAHVASCMAENGVPLGAGPVLGIALDGLGHGDDGTFWGGELLLAGYAGFERVGRLRPVAMPGGTQAVREPWRNAFAHLDAAIGWERCAAEHAGLDLVRFLAARPLATLRAMAARGINSPPASSCGRLFDAVAAAVGLCRERASWEGEAAVLLEAAVDEPAVRAAAGYPFAVAAAGPGEPLTLDPAPMWRALLADLARGCPPGIIAARFHRGLAAGLVEMAVRAAADADGRRRTSIVALSGGSFQNRWLLELVADGLRRQDLAVLAHRRVPCGDGGLALGQAAVAAARALVRKRPRVEGRGPCASGYRAAS